MYLLLSNDNHVFYVTALSAIKTVIIIVGDAYLQLLVCENCDLNNLVCVIANRFFSTGYSIANWLHIVLDLKGGYRPATMKIFPL